MSFDNKKYLNDRISKTVKISGILCVLLWIAGSFLLKYIEGYSVIKFTIWSLIAFMGYWVIYRKYLYREILCEKCGFSLSYIISLLAKDSSEGFCPSVEIQSHNNSRHGDHTCYRSCGSCGPRYVL